MKVVENPEVLEIIDNYPVPVRKKLLQLRQLVLDTALEIDSADKLEETLKWGEPSYVTKRGSTVRVDWDRSNPDQYAIYFHCKTKLVDTFKELYRDQFQFDGNRAIIFKLSDDLAVKELKHCISLSLRYHSVKHLPLLGA